jgi:hypothetical protein
MPSLSLVLHHSPARDPDLDPFEADQDQDHEQELPPIMR